MTHDRSAKLLSKNTSRIDSVILEGTSWEVMSCSIYRLSQLMTNFSQLFHLVLDWQHSFCLSCDYLF